MSLKIKIDGNYEEVQKCEYEILEMRCGGNIITEKYLITMNVAFEITTEKNEKYTMEIDDIETKIEMEEYFERSLHGLRNEEINYIVFEKCKDEIHNTFKDEIEIYHGFCKMTGELDI